MSNEDIPGLEVIIHNGKVAGFPPALIKALYDTEWDYALGLRNGTIIRFKGASYNEGEWIHLLSDGDDDIKMIGVDYSFARGIDIRISDISWVADAPDGS